MPILLVLALVGFCSALSVRILDPLVPDIARAFSADPKTVALLATAFAFPYAVGQPILGPLGDALGKARIIQACIAVLALALAACALAPSLETLFAARIVSGLASGGIIPLSFAIIGDRFSMQERQVALSRVLAALLTGGILGGFISGLIGSWLGWRAVVWTVVAITIVAMALTFSGLQPRPDAARSRFSLASLRQGYREVFANPRAAVCYTAVFVEGLALFGILPFLALILEDRAAGSIREAGFLIAALGVGGLLFTTTVRRLLASLGGMNLIRYGGPVTGLAIALAAISPTWPLMLIAFLIAGYGFYMIHNSLQTQATELAPGARGAAVALHAFFFFLGHAVGPILFGLAKIAIGAGPAMLVSAMALAALGPWVAGRLTAARSG